MARTIVTPPARAADVPVSQSSLWVAPGSRKWTWGSINPGSLSIFPRAGKKKRADNGSLEDKRNNQPGRLENEISEGKKWNHIGRNYRQGGSFVKGITRQILEIFIQHSAQFDL
jgi:hypothetical protein